MLRLSACLGDRFSMSKGFIFVIHLQKSLMKSYTAVIIYAFLFTNNTFSQTDPALKYAETITQSGLKKQLTIIASAEMEGRETGTEGQRKAAAYIETQFKEMGLLTSPL